MSTTFERRLRLESLEDRPMLAGLVTAVLGGPVSQPTLTIREAAGHAGRANSIRISEQPGGQIRIDGRSQSGRASSLVNGYAYQDFAIPAGGLTIEANLGGGCDTLRILPGMQLRNLALHFGGSDSDADTTDFNFADSFLVA